MASAMLDTIMRSMTPSLTSKLASFYGESESSVRKGLPAALGSVLAMLASQTDDAGIMSQVHALADDPASDLSMLGDPGQLLNRMKGEVKDGLLERMQSTLLGAAPRGITDAIATYAGIRPVTALSMLKGVVPLVFAYLGTLTRQNNFDVAGLTRRLSAERESLTSALPAPLANMFFGRTVAPARAIMGGVVETGTLAARRQSWWPAVLTLVGVLAVGWGLLGFMNRARREGGVPGATGTMGYITRTLPGGEGLRAPAQSTEARLLAYIENTGPLGTDTWFEFDNVTFDTDSTTLTPGSREQLLRIASILRAFPNVHVTIGGYTDNSGDRTANVALSQARATAVMSELEKMNVQSRRLEAKGYGEEHPIADNTTADGRARNRRVALQVTSR